MKKKSILDHHIDRLYKDDHIKGQDAVIELSEEMYQGIVRNLETMKDAVEAVIRDTAKSN